MRISSVLCFLIICPSLAGYSQAGAKPLKKHKPYLILLESYSQQTISGRKGGPRPVSTHFIIVWEGSRFPECFFWRSDSDFAACNVVKAHKIVSDRHFNKGPDYATEELKVKTIHKGDTLELTPGINQQLPDGIPQTSKNALFFKTGGSSWLDFPVNSITKKRAITMP